MKRGSGHTLELYRGLFLNRIAIKKASEDRFSKKSKCMADDPCEYKRFWSGRRTNLSAGYNYHQYSIASKAVNFYRILSGSLRVLAGILFQITAIRYRERLL